MRRQSLIVTETLARAELSDIWVTEREYARFFSLNRQSLANWRWADRRLGLKSARPGYPTYKYIGGTVRYLLDRSTRPGGDGVAA